MLKDKFAKLESKAPNKITPVDLDSACEQVERLKQFAIMKRRMRENSHCPQPVCGYTTGATAGNTSSH